MSAHSDMTILLVDDDLQAQASTRKILELENYRVLVAENGEEALNLLRDRGAQDIALVLSDLRMPKMTGIELLKAMRICGISLPFVLMTAYGEVDDAVWALKNGASDFLTKPFKRLRLLESIRFSIEMRC